MGWNHQLDINQHPTISWAALKADRMLGASVEGCLSIGIGHLVGQWLFLYVILLSGGWVSGVRGEEKNEFVFQKNEIDEFGQNRKPINVQTVLYPLLELP